MGKVLTQDEFNHVVAENIDAVHGEEIFFAHCELATTWEVLRTSLATTALRHHCATSFMQVSFTNATHRYIFAAVLFL